MIRRKRIGEMLTEAGLLTEDALEAAIAAPRPKGMKLGQFLVREGIVREGDLIQELSTQLRVQIFAPDSFPVDADLAPLIPASMAAKLQLAPLRREGSLLFVAMTDPTDILAMDAVQEKIQLEVEPVICSEEAFENLMASIYGLSGGSEEEMAAEADEVTYGHEDEAVVDQSEVGNLLDIAEGQTAVRNVNWIIAQAARNGASDVHISPERAHVRIRMRVDGVLKELPSLPKSVEASVVSRLKILARMDISITRMPQDGRLTARISGKEIQLRVSTMPTIHGENVVLRLLGLSTRVLTFEELGMSREYVDRVEAAMEYPTGLILSTGPTGSGKTTSLYSMLSRLNRPEVNIITVEDPVEYRMERVRQVELNTKAGMTFASSLRAILRQDPDIIMVGEIRDRETASIAVQASLTGHLVLSTMHTNDAVGTISRLVDMGIEPFLISSVLSLAIGQRLVRRVCEHCAEPWTPPAEALSFWGIDPREAEKGNFVKSRGCHQCRQTGYRGRLGIFEVLLLNERLRQSILRGGSEYEIVQTARAEFSFRTLREDAVLKVMDGRTTMEEAATVAGS